MFRGEYEGRQVEGVYSTRDRAVAEWRKLQAAQVAHWRSFRDNLGNRLAESAAREEPDIEEYEVQD